MAAEAGGILDTPNTIGIPNFDGTDANLGWRVKVEAYALLAGMGAHLDAAAEQTSFIDFEGLDAHSLLARRAVHALVCHQVWRESSFSGFPARRHPLEAWPVITCEYQGKAGNRMAAFLRGVRNPRARWKKMYSERRDLGDMLASREKYVAQCRVAAGADLPTSGSGGNRDGARASSLPVIS